MLRLTCTVNSYIRKISIIGITTTYYKQSFLIGMGVRLAGVKRAV